MGSNPSNSVINRYSQSWDVSNLFIYGASAFPQNIGYNPTGLLAGLAYFSAAKLRDTYLKSPGPLVSRHEVGGRSRDRLASAWRGCWPRWASPTYRT